jgi:hypothetical protein
MEPDRSPTAAGLEPVRHSTAARTGGSPTASFAIPQHGSILSRGGHGGVHHSAATALSMSDFTSAMEALVGAVDPLDAAERPECAARSAAYAARSVREATGDHAVAVGRHHAGRWRSRSVHWRIKPAQGSNRRSRASRDRGTLEILTVPHE